MYAPFACGGACCTMYRLMTGLARQRGGHAVYCCRRDKTLVCSSPPFPSLVRVIRGVALSTRKSDMTPKANSGDIALHALLHHQLESAGAPKEFLQISAPKAK